MKGSSEKSVGPLIIDVRLSRTFSTEVSATVSFDLFINKDVAADACCSGVMERFKLSFIDEDVVDELLELFAIAVNVDTDVDGDELDTDANVLVTGVTTFVIMGMSNELLLLLFVLLCDTSADVNCGGNAIGGGMLETCSHI